MILYRIEPAYCNYSMDFVPVVPHRLMRGENNTTKRICVAKSIKDCIYASPYSLHGDGVPYFSVFRVFEFDIDKNDEAFLDTFEIEDDVPDAYESNECWIVRPITASRMYYIGKITDNNGMGISYDIISESEIYNIVDISVIDNDSKNSEIEYLFKNGFDDYHELIRSWKIREDGKMIIESDFLFWGKKFEDIVNEENI